MKKLLFIGLISIVIFSCKKEGQKTYPESILAGQSSGTGVKYIDILPDDTINPINSSSKDYLIDLNHDGITDFKLHAYLFQAPGFGYTSRTIIPFNDNEFVFAGVDSTLVDTISSSVSINKNLNWTHMEGTLYSTSWDSQMSGYYFSGLLNGVNDKYVGTRIFVGDGVLYGWIRLRVIDGAIFVVYDYACTEEN